MTDPQVQQERRSIDQMTEVARARQARLQREREQLRATAVQLARARADQLLDEGLLGEQRARWAHDWQAWVRSGGAIWQAVSLRQDKALLNEMATLVNQRRAELQSQEDELQHKTRDWARRWLAAQSFNQSLSARQRAWQTQAERVSERRLDEDALLIVAHGCKPGGTSSLSAGS